MTEAVYNGYRFRSVLAAQWAVFFDTLGVAYEYQKEGYRTGQVWYYPDFWLPQQKRWVEIREQAVDKQDVERATVLVTNTGNDVYFFSGEIPLPDPSDLSAQYSGGAEVYAWDDGRVVNDQPYWWCECPICGLVDLCFDGWTERLSCRHVEIKTPNIASSRLIAAYTAARSASFAATGQDLRIKTSMEQWQIDALQMLLKRQVSEVEQGERVYTSSKNYGSSLYHLIDKRGDDVQIEQIDVDEKWSKRVVFHDQEVFALLKTLLTWHLEEVKLELDRKPFGGGGFSSPDDDENILGNLDDHPF